MEALSPSEFLSIPSDDSRIKLHAGLRINYPPHVGTYFLLASTFLLAKHAGSHGNSSEVRIQALDNAPVLLIGDSLFGLRRPLYVQSNRSERLSFIDQYYGRFLQNVSKRTGVSYRTALYSDAQSAEFFRNAFLRSLDFRTALKWSISPLHALLGWKDAIGIRFPCPDCGLSTTYGETTRVLHNSSDDARFELNCEDHGTYRMSVNRDSDVILDLQKIMRNILKEVEFAADTGTRNLIVKGSDWIPACPFVDRGIQSLGFEPLQRIFLPVFTTEAGTKLSKSGIHHNDPEFQNLPDRIAHAWEYFQEKDAVESILHYAHRILSSDESSAQMIPFTRLKLH